MGLSRLALPLLLTACAVPPLGEDSRPRGPLPARNQHPLAQTLLQTRPRSVSTQADGTYGVAFDWAHTAIHEIHAMPGQTVWMDGETSRASLRIRRGFGDSTDVEVEAAWLHSSSGFMDSLIEAFHELTGLPNQGREDFPQDQFRMRLRRGGHLLFDVREDHLQIADVTVAVTHRVRDEGEDNAGLAFRAAVELPVGDEDTGGSNGGVDFGGGALLERSFDRWTLYGGLDYISPADPPGFEAGGYTLDDIALLSFGVEYRWSDGLSWLGQAVWSSPMTSEFTFEEMDREVFTVAAGAAFDGPFGSKMHFTLEEDAVSATGPDFGMSLGMRWGF